MSKNCVAKIEGSTWRNKKGEYIFAFFKFMIVMFDFIIPTSLLGFPNSLLMFGGMQLLKHHLPHGGRS